MSIAKLPLIMGVIFGPQITYTPPSDAPLLHERARIKGERFTFRPTAYAPYIKMLLLFPAIIEIAVVIVNNVKWLPGSIRILTTLMMNERTECIYVTPLSSFGAFLATYGALIRLSSYHAMGKQFTLELSILDNHKLVTEGPYRVVRHPSYTGALLHLAGLFCFHGSRGSWMRESGLSNSLLGGVLIGVWVSMVAWPIDLFRKRIPLEDRALRHEFGEAWERWARKVPYRLVPGIY